jgi:hypothetical protein
MLQILKNKYFITAVIIVVIIIIVIVIIKRRKSDYRNLLKELKFANKDFYLSFYANQDKYTAAQKQQFLKNYQYSEDFFRAIKTDVEKLQGNVKSGFFNPLEAIKNVIGLFNTSNMRQIYGTYILQYKDQVKSQIMFSMMCNRYNTETNGRNMMDDITTFYDAETCKELYNYLKKLPLSV